MSDSQRLRELQSKRNADERFLSHRETHELLRLQELEIERLRLERDMLALNVIPRGSSVYVVWDGENVAAVAWPESVASSETPLLFPNWYTAE